MPLRAFLWAGVSTRKVTVKVAWNDICLPKDEGGLGIPNIIVANRAYMAKHIWDLASKKDTLWVKWCHTYMIKDKCFWTCNCGQSASWTWRKILKLLLLSMKWGMGGIYLFVWTIGIVCCP